MPQLRVLAASLLASAIVFPAIGQSFPTTPNPAPLAATITGPSILVFGNPAVTLATKPTATLSPLAVKPGDFTLKASKDNAALGVITTGKPLTLSDKATKQLLDREIKSLSAKSDGPCYKLRSYSFTARDLKSPHPHSSSETDCTPATSAHLKMLQVPATQSPAASSALQIITVPTTAK